MKFPQALVHDFEGVTQNFEFLQGSGLYWGSGAPTFAPDGGAGFYLRSDTPTVANQRIYVYSGSSWTGIL